MNHKIGIVCIMFAALGVAGCASMSGDECLTSDWQGIGYEDGANGYAAERVGKHRKACAKHGVTPDLAAYRNGREQGLIEYCNAGRGFSVGSNGGRYNGVCPVELEQEFLDAYNTGYHLFTLKSNVRRVSSAINSREHELLRTEESIRETEADLISTETSVEERIILLADLKDLAERSGQLEKEIRNLYADRARYQIELDRYQVMVANLDY